jgi:pimeloyl-ACP methyl ester carboxylesterase
VPILQFPDKKPKTGRKRDAIYTHDCSQRDRAVLLEQGQGPLVVLCHGWPELSYSWRHQISAIADAGFHVVAPDMRGYGRSSAPDDVGACSIFDTVGDVVALVTAVGETKAVIVGHD